VADEAADGDLGLASWRGAGDGAPAGSSSQRDFKPKSRRPPRSPPTGRILYIAPGPAVLVFSIELKRALHHILELFDPDGPEPTLRIYLSLLEVAGACFAGGNSSTVPTVLKWIDDRRQGTNLDITTLATLAGRPSRRASSPHLESRHRCERDLANPAGVGDDLQHPLSRRSHPSILPNEIAAGQEGPRMVGPRHLGSTETQRRIV
jgi:hypothetical protein